MLFREGHNAGDEDEKRRPDGEGVVLLVGGDGEEEQREGGEEREQPDGAGAEARLEGGGDERARLVVVAELREPGAAGLPGDGEERGEEEAPGKEPDEVQEPVGERGELIVVVRIALAEEAEDVLVDEVEVPPAVDVTKGGDVTDGMAFAAIGAAYEDVPGGRDGEEQKRAGEGLEVAPASALAREPEVGDGSAKEKHRGDEAFDQQGERECGPRPVDARGLVVLEAGEKAVQRDEE